MKGTDGVIKLVPGFAVLSAFGLVLLAAAPEEQSPKPQYDAKGNLLRPANYRDWEFLSAGYGMNYIPAPGSHEMFTNAFIQRWAYEDFLKSGKWPEQSMFVIDVRDAERKGSINKKGHFQTDLMGLEVEVKDSTRNPEKWAYYGFEPNAKTAGKAIVALARKFLGIIHRTSRTSGCLKTSPTLYSRRKQRHEPQDRRLRLRSARLRSGSGGSVAAATWQAKTPRQ